MFDNCRIASVVGFIPTRPAVLSGTTISHALDAEGEAPLITRFLGPRNTLPGGSLPYLAIFTRYSADNRIYVRTPIIATVEAFGGLFDV